MPDIRRFTLIKKIGTLGEFKMIVTDKNLYAKLPVGYERCGKSFLAIHPEHISSNDTYIYQ